MSTTPTAAPMIVLSRIQCTHNDEYAHRQCLPVALTRSSATAHRRRPRMYHPTISITAACARCAAAPQLAACAAAARAPRPQSLRHATLSYLLNGCGRCK
eukprot:scaffold1450_cov119-Isochrysis_galbana.AAC.4